MNSTGTAATHSVEGPEDDSVDADVGFLAPERLAAVALSFFGADKRIIYKGIILNQCHLQDFKQDRWNASSVVDPIS